MKNIIKKRSVSTLEYENYKSNTANLNKVVQNATKGKNKRVANNYNNIRYSRGSLSYTTDFYNEYIKNQKKQKASKKTRTFRLEYC
ncbi:hypothetical protein [Clostridium novyi]|uniref:hypothetical protein n=1 Tax=Clostridium novyi TaxID=1542 RepID=UPI000A6B0051|nr:hypothetical protein [Clostridium novyi]